MRNTDAALLCVCLAMAGFPATGQPSPPYAGSEACGVCHEDISNAFAKSPHHLVDTREQFSDINLKLHSLGPKLPSGATGVQFQSDFGDTAAFMMTVASPPIDDLEIQMRSRSLEDAIRSARSAAGPSKSQRISIVYTFPLTLSKMGVTRATEAFRLEAERSGLARRSVLIRYSW